MHDAGHQFESETDTEVVVHLVTHYLDQGMSPVEAATTAVKRLTGAFALVMIFTKEELLLIAARRGSPLAVGYGEKESYLGSDAFSLAPFTNRVTYLEDGDVAVAKGASVTIFDASGKTVKRPIQTVPVSAGMVDKGSHDHFMAKEIHEQPEVVGHTLSRYLDAAGPRVDLPDSELALFKNAPRLTMSACGTAYYAGLVGKYWFEKLARLPVEVDVASELRYREPGLSSRRTRAVRLAVGRDRRHARRLARRERGGAAHRLGRERPRELDRARIRNHLAHLCRP